MPRLLGVEIPAEKRIEASLTYIYGVGPTTAKRVLEQTKTARAKGTDAAKHEDALKQLGILNLKYFVLDQNQSSGKTHTRASLSFSEAQRGIPSWQLDSAESVPDLAARYGGRSRLDAELTPGEPSTAPSLAGLDPSAEGS